MGMSEYEDLLWRLRKYAESAPGVMKGPLDVAAIQAADAIQSLSKRVEDLDNFVSDFVNAIDAAEGNDMVSVVDTITDDLIDRARAIRALKSDD
jgi:3-methyladenine DNA glycosylase Tag